MAGLQGEGFRAVVVLNLSMARMLELLPFVAADWAVEIFDLFEDGVVRISINNGYPRDLRLNEEAY